MLPVIDYGGIAIVIPSVAAVGRVSEQKEKYAFEVFLRGIGESLLVVFDSKKEADESREGLIALIARYYYTEVYGSDFDPAMFDQDLLGDDFDDFDDDIDDEDDTDHHRERH